jgi:transposase-like protein
MAKRDNKFWESLENEYITSNTSYRGLANKHGVSFNTLKRRADKANWPEKRLQYGHKRATEIEKNQKLQAGQEAKEIVQMKREERDECKLIKKAVLNRLIIKDEKGIKAINPALDDPGIRALSSSLKNVQDMLYRSYGIADQNVNMNITGGTYEEWLKKQQEERGLVGKDYDTPPPDLSITDKVDNIDRLDYDYKEKEEKEESFLKKVNGKK